MLCKSRLPRARAHELDSSRAFRTPKRGNRPPNEPLAPGKPQLQAQATLHLRPNSETQPIALLSLAGPFACWLATSWLSSFSALGEAKSARSEQQPPPPRGARLSDARRGCSPCRRIEPAESQTQATRGERGRLLSSGCEGARVLEPKRGEGGEFVCLRSTVGAVAL